MFPLLPFASEIFCSSSHPAFGLLRVEHVDAAGRLPPLTPSPLRLYCVDTHNHSPLDIFRRNDIPTLTISISMQPYYVRVGLGGNKNSYLATLFSLHRPQRLIEFFPLFFSIPISVSRPDKNDIRPLPTFFWEGRGKWAAIAGAFFFIHIHHHLSLLHLRPSQPLPTSPSINNLRRGRGSGPIG